MTLVAAEDAVHSPLHADSQRLKEAMRKLAALSGEEVAEEISNFIEELQETASARSSRIDELEAEIEDMIPEDEAYRAILDDESVVRSLATCARMLKAGQSAAALDELTHTLDRSGYEWRLYAS